MKFQLVIQEEALIEIVQIIDWYEEKRIGLGYEFLDELEDAFNKVCNHPLHYKMVNKFFRRIITHRFPYIVIYEIENNTIIVNTVMHTKRKPKF